MRRARDNETAGGGGPDGFEEPGGADGLGGQHKRFFSEFQSIDAYLSDHSFKTPCMSQSGYYGSRDRSLLQPHYSYLQQTKLAHANRLNPADGICTHFLRKVKPKERFYNRDAPIDRKPPVSASMWTSNGKWLVLGAQKAADMNSMDPLMQESLPEFALYDPETLSWDRTVQIPAINKTCAITKLTWNLHGDNFVAAYDNGQVQLFDDTFRCINGIKAHKDSAVTGVCFSPNDGSLATSGDDKNVKIWDVQSFQRGGHSAEPKLLFNDLGSEVKCLDWHPFRSLISAGTKDGKIKLYDPKQGSCVCTISSPKGMVQDCQFNQNGNWLASGGKDSYIRVFDIRMNKEIESRKGHNSDVCSLAWHPEHESLLVSGGYNGSMIYWVMGQQDPLHTAIAQAHKWCIEVLTWHPLGHYLASISQDGWMKFWCREPPGSVMDDAKCSAPAMGYMSMKVTDLIGEPMNPVKFGYGPLGRSKTTDSATAAIPDVLQSTSSSARFEGFQSSVFHSSGMDPSGLGGGGGGYNQYQASSRPLGQHSDGSGGGGGGGVYGRVPRGGGRFGGGRGRFSSRGGR